MKSTIYLKLANGRILEECQAGASETSLWLYLKNLSMKEAAEIAFDPEAIQHIEFYFGNLHNTYEGYTEVGALMHRGKTIEVQLKGGSMTEEEVENEKALPMTEEETEHEADDSGDGPAIIPDGAGDAG